MNLTPYAGPARVVVGFDGSDDAGRALQYGIVEAKRRQAELVVVHAVDDTVLNSAWGVVFDPEEIKLGAAEMLASTIETAVAAGMDRGRVRTQVVLGNPAAALTRLSSQASLVVLGRRSASAGEKEFVGSTAVGVVGAAHCPVIVVSAADAVHDAPIGTIGVAVDTSARGAVALEWALNECQAHGGDVAVISVCRAPQGRWFSGGHPTAEQQKAAVDVTRERMAEMIQPLAAAFPDVEVELEVDYGVPLDILATRTAKLDLLVLEVHAAFPTYSVGGLIRGLLSHGRCPIGVIRPKDAHGS
ncbi:MAG TPA: universal stress protein [Propionicimonas sp.]|nr:universal stress protein [Propionicimonas sp.]HRA05900.1 universal stress protein [Propionicimonas sp.]